MAEVDNGLMAQAIREWREAPFRLKGAKLREWCRVLGIGRDAFYLEAKNWGEMKERKVRADKGKGKLALPDIREQVRRLWQLKHRPPPGVRLGSTETALIYAVEQGLVPPELAAVPVGTLNRHARELDLVEASERQTRWQAAYANQVHQFDSSHSEHFIPVRRDGDDWILKLRPRRLKNKEKVEHLAVIAYGLCDDFSGLRLSRYTVAAGESALGSIEFLQWAWSREPQHAPFEGWPDELYGDNGPLLRHQAFDKFAERLGLTVTRHLPYKSRCTGKVENNWRTLWRKFENVYFFNPAWESFEIRLSELNAECAAFWKKHNQLPHRQLRLTREAAWHDSIVQRGGVVRVEPGAWGEIFVEAERVLDAAGCFDFKGAAYQVEAGAIWGGKIKVFANIKDGSLIVQDQRDGKRYRAVPFDLAAWGEFRGSPKGELERLKDEDKAAPKVAAPPTWLEESGNLRILPVRPAEVRESGFDMPPGPPVPKGGETLEELAAEARVIERGAEVEVEEPLAPTLDQYVALKIQVAKGERLTPREAAFLPWFEEACAGLLRDFESDVAMRVKLALVG